MGRVLVEGRGGREVEKGTREPECGSVYVLCRVLRTSN